MLHAVLFDLDNTLIDRNRAFEQCLADNVALTAARDELRRLDQGGHGPRNALFSAWQKHVATSLDQMTLGAMIAERIRPDHRLLDALRTLSMSVKTGVITNGGGPSQRGKFCAAGLSEVIAPEHLWISAEVGFAKPDPAIFLQASRFMEAAPEDCLFIGDYAPHDLAGARAAGMRSYLVDSVLTADSLTRLMSRELRR